MRQRSNDERSAGLCGIRAAMDRVKLEAKSDNEFPLFVDLSPFLDGTYHQEVPTVSKTFGTKCLFYAGRLNEIHAEPATGKTNVLMAASVAELEEGGTVLYIDPEDTPEGFTRRIRMLGASPNDVRERVKYLHNPSQEEILAAQTWALQNKPTLVILDGLAESMAAVGADENKASDVLIFFRKNLRPFAEAGAAVVIADHVTKSAENRGQFARGSGAKAGRYDGVSYEIVAAKAYTPNQEGFVRLKVQKDRNGGVGARGVIAAELHFIPGTAGQTLTTFREPAETPEGPWKPTAIMGKIMKHLEAVGEESTSGLRGLGGNTEHTGMAIRYLKEEGKIDIRKEGKKILHFIVSSEEGA